MMRNNNEADEVEFSGKRIRKNFQKRFDDPTGGEIAK